MNKRYLVRQGNTKIEHPKLSSYILYLVPDMDHYEYTPFTINGFHSDILNLIFNQCDNASIVICQYVCRRWHDQCTPIRKKKGAHEHFLFIYLIENNDKHLMEWALSRKTPKRGWKKGSCMRDRDHILYKAMSKFHRSADLATIQFVHRNICDVNIDIESAVRAGRLDTLEWLDAIDQFNADESHLFYLAVANGELVIMHWLKEFATMRGDYYDMVIKYAINRIGNRSSDIDYIEALESYKAISDKAVREQKIVHLTMFNTFFIELRCIGILDWLYKHVYKGSIPKDDDSDDSSSEEDDDSEWYRAKMSVDVRIKAMDNKLFRIMEWFFRHGLYPCEYIYQHAVTTKNTNALAILNEYRSSSPRKPVFGCKPVDLIMLCQYVCERECSVEPSI